MEKDQKLFSEKYFDATKSLVDLAIARWIFWLTLLFVFGFSAFILMAESSRLTLDVSHSGWNYLFMEVLQVPIKLLILGTSALGLTALVHRSAQSKHQIDQAQTQIANVEKQINNSQAQIMEAAKQNSFTQFYTHKREFIDYFKDIREGEIPDILVESITQRQIRIYYDMFFPNMSYDTIDYNPDIGRMNDIEIDLVLMLYMLDELMMCTDNAAAIRLYLRFLVEEQNVRNTLLINGMDQGFLKDDSEYQVNFKCPRDGLNQTVRLPVSGIANLGNRARDYLDYASLLRSNICGPKLRSIYPHASCYGRVIGNLRSRNYEDILLRIQSLFNGSLELEIIQTQSESDEYEQKENLFESKCQADRLRLEGFKQLQLSEA